MYTSRDPFLELYELMGNATKVESPFLFGKVTSELPNLKVLVGNITLDREDLSIDQNIIISNNANVSCSNGSISHNLKDKLNVNDKVLIIRVDDKFIVTSKVIAL